MEQAVKEDIALSNLMRSTSITPVAGTSQPLNLTPGGDASGSFRLSVSPSSSMSGSELSARMSSASPQAAFTGLGEQRFNASPNRRPAALHASPSPSPIAAQSQDGDDSFATPGAMIASAVDVAMDAPTPDVPKPSPKPSPRRTRSQSQVINAALGDTPEVPARRQAPIAESAQTPPTEVSQRARRQKLDTFADDAADADAADAGAGAGAAPQRRSTGGQQPPQHPAAAATPSLAGSVPSASPASETVSDVLAAATSLNDARMSTPHAAQKLAAGGGRDVMQLVNSLLGDTPGSTAGGTPVAAAAAQQGHDEEQGARRTRSQTIIDAALGDTPEAAAAQEHTLGGGIGCCGGGGGRARLETREVHAAVDAALGDSPSTAAQPSPKRQSPSAGELPPMPSPVRMSLGARQSIGTFKASSSAAPLLPTVSPTVVRASQRKLQMPAPEPAPVPELAPVPPAALEEPVPTAELSPEAHEQAAAEARAQAAATPARSRADSAVLPPSSFFPGSTPPSLTRTGAGAAQPARSPLELSRTPNAAAGGGRRPAAAKTPQHAAMLELQQPPSVPAPAAVAVAQPPGTPSQIPVLKSRLRQPTKFR